MERLRVLEWFLSVFFVGIQTILGPSVFFTGMRFKKSAGATVDQTAFWGNWIVFSWMWAARAKEIVTAMPFFSKDLSENFGVKKDDGRIT